METNHKEILDQVIGEVSEATAPEAEPEQNIGKPEEEIGPGCIRLDSCTGEGFYIDPKNNPELFAPENIMTHIANFAQQEQSLINIQNNLLKHSQTPLPEFQEYLNGLIPQLERALVGYGLTSQIYREIGRNLSDYELALYMIFDLFSFTKTILGYLESITMVNLSTTVAPENGFAKNDVFEAGEVELPDGSGNKCYKVYGHIQQDNTVTIIQVEESSIDPSDMLIVHDEDGDELDCVISLHTVAKTEEAAARDAKIVFDGYVRDMLETDADRAYRIAEEMQADSGLLG